MPVNVPVNVPTSRIERPLVIIDRHEVARLLGTSERHVRRLASDGRLPVVRIGGKVRYIEADVLDMIVANRIERPTSSTGVAEEHLRGAPPFRYPCP